MSDEAKLHIDDDWKSEAQREKERLAEEVERDAAGWSDSAGPQPQADFRSIVNVLAMQAMIGLGGMRTGGGRVVPPSPELAKLHIDMLEVLEQKTKGNLSEDEQRLLDTTLYQLRMAYVELMSAPPPGAAPRGGPADS
jgi:hypothetical protein